MKPAGDAAEEKLADLVRQAKRGSREAFMELYKLFYHELYAYASYMLRHPQDAEDVVSDTIVAAFESIGKLRDVYRFRQWLFKILSNQCKKRRKSYAERNRRHKLDFPGEEQTVSGSGRPLRRCRRKNAISLIHFFLADTGEMRSHRVWG